MAIARHFMPRLGLGSRCFRRGESVIAAVGLAVAVIVLLVMGAAAWWTTHTQGLMLDEARRREIHTLGAVLSRAVESMLASNDLSPLRRLMVEASKDYALSECRVVLPDGTVIADADPSRITRVASLPERWESGPLDSHFTSDNVYLARENLSIVVPGRGTATLLIAGGPARPQPDLWPSQAGIAMVGAFGLVILLVVYRHLRDRLETVGMIRDALLATRDGVNDAPALMVTARTGPEAQAWNKLLDENSTLRRRALVRQPGDMGQGGRGRSAEFEQAFDALTLGVAIINHEGLVTYANGAAAVCLRRKREEIVGKPLAPLVTDERVKQALDAVTNGNARPRAAVEIEHRDSSGGGVLRFTIRPLWREGVCGGLVTIDDVTQQRVADDSRNAFIAQATHELRTPLTNMRLYLDVAVDDKSDAALRGKAMNVISQECRRLEHMVSEMLSVAQIEAGSLQLNRDDIRLTKLLEELQADYAGAASDKKINLQFVLPPKLPTVLGDREKFALALHNLIGNAIKYSPDGGRVTVTAAADAGSLQIDVADTGIGIPVEEQERIFERFYRATDARARKITGTGLGLTLAREVARLHGGDITVQSQPGKGSTFTLTIPITGAAD